MGISIFYCVWSSFGVEGNAEEIFETLDDAHERLKELKEERNKLLKANKKLVDVLIEVEDVLEDAGYDLDDLADQTYSFEGGWQGHEERLKVGEASSESVDRQLRELEKILDDVESL